MSEKLPLYLLSAVMGLSLIGCNSESQNIDTVTYSSVEVQSFALSANPKVLENLDSVFFSIDLASARIYNADSLPKGTDVSKLVVRIGTGTVSGVELIVNRGEKGDTTYNYLESQSDSIDFSHGPVILRVTAQDGSQTRDYDLRVNVHQVVPDSMAWGDNALRALPTSLDAPVVQKSISHDSKAWCLTADASGRACLATAENPALGWTTHEVSLPTGAIVRSFCATTGEFYITTADSELYTSADGFSWTSTGSRMTTLFGGSLTTLVGALRADDGSWSLVSYPASAMTPVAAPADFPVEATSALLTWTTDWSDNPTSVMAGGLRADGQPTGSVWGWDGSKWACLNASSPLPPLSDVALVPFFSFNTSDTWNVTRQSALFVLGGRDDHGEATRSVYISRDRGITWKIADTPMRFPAIVPDFFAADALCFATTMDENGAIDDAWHRMPAPSTPRWWEIAEEPMSRVSAPITQWECPYIYLFGGLSNDLTLRPTLWRGTINRLTFKPLY